MKLKDAIDVGQECGLETPAECVNNIILHAMNLFPYDDINIETKELVEEAEKEGVKFCVQCGGAMIKDDGCYMCRNFGTIGGKP